MRAAALRRLTLLAACLFAANLAAATLTPAEEAGRRIFTEGTSPSGGRITARLGFGDFEVPGSALPCAGCHGQDGLGRPEGGLVPPNIQWSELTKPYGHVHPAGRKHPAFDERSLAKAFTFGVDPAGNDLDPAMPRFRMSDEDAASLVAYLRRVGSILPPGVSSHALRIGTVLPATGRFAEAGRTLRALLEASFRRINDRGGIYGRHLELVVADYGDSPEDAYANAWKMIGEGQVFLLLAPFTAGWEGSLGRMATEESIPVVAPITLFPEDSRSSNLQVFHLLSGVSELAQVLALHAAGPLGLKAEPVLVLHAAGAGGTALAQTLVQHLGEMGFESVLPPASFVPGAADLGALARSLAERRARAVFVLGPGLDVAGLARAAADLGTQPYLLLPGPFAPPDIGDIPTRYGERIFLCYPSLPSDQRPAALEDYASLVGGRPAPRPPHLAQAYAATLAMVKALKDIGRDLSREKFARALEGLNAFDTGMLPPLSYNADRRIGVLGGYIVAVDGAQHRFRPTGGFQPLPAADVVPPAAQRDPK